MFAFGIGFFCELLFYRVAFIDYLAVSNAVDYLESTNKRILDPTNKVDNKLIATLAAINSLMESRRKKAVEELIVVNAGDYNMLSPFEKRIKAGEVIDKEISLKNI